MQDDHSPPIDLRGKRVVLLLQGGGALGAYQVGAYAALRDVCASADATLDWVGGISIGAINAAVIAGPVCGDTVAELDRLWDDLLSPPFPPFDATAAWRNLPPALRNGWLAPLIPKYASWMWSAFNPLGQAQFFGSRVLDPLANPWLRQWSGPREPSVLSFYDTKPLRRTLDKHVDWAAINGSGGPRLSLGAARVRDGEAVFFNSFDSQNPAWAKRTLNAEHVLASGALPPGFPAISIDGEYYWDGGVTTNTPIAELAEDLTTGVARETIVFLINVWDRQGAEPRTLDEVIWRQKSIAYGSRKEAAVSIVNAYELAVQAKRAAPIRFEVCQVMLEQPPDDTAPQFCFADADFSRSTYEPLKRIGQADMREAIAKPYRVPGVGGEYAILYRHGTYAKHRTTDRKYAAARAREQQRLRAFEGRNGTRAAATER